MIDIRISDASGAPIPSATIRWRALEPSSPPTPSSSGTAGTLKRQFAIGPRLAWSETF